MCLTCNTQVLLFVLILEHKIATKIQVLLLMEVTFQFYMREFLDENSDYYFLSSFGQERFLFWERFPFSDCDLERLCWVVSFKCCVILLLKIIIPDNLSWSLSEKGTCFKKEKSSILVLLEHDDQNLRRTFPYQHENALALIRVLQKGLLKPVVYLEIWKWHSIRCFLGKQ